MLYMLDTDTCSYIIKKRPLSVLEKFEKLSMDDICISVITFSELLYGIERCSSKNISRKIVNEFARHLSILSWDDEAAEFYAYIRHSLEKKGTPIGNMDLMIAAHACSRKATVITNNTKHFGRVPKLKIENWV